MSDGISDGYREQERYERWMERREAACVVLNVVLSPLAVREKIAKQFYCLGEELTKEKAKERMQKARRSWSGDRPPINWNAACRLLGAEDSPKVPVACEATLSPVVEAAMWQLGIMKSGSASPSDVFVQLEGQDAPVWARLLRSLELDETNVPWRDRLQALSPFADRVVLIFEPRDHGREVDYAISLAKTRGQYLETHGVTRYGSETKLRVAAVPRVDALQ